MQINEIEKRKLKIENDFERQANFKHKILGNFVALKLVSVNHFHPTIHNYCCNLQFGRASAGKCIRYSLAISTKEEKKLIENDEKWAHCSYDMNLDSIDKPRKKPM